MLSRHGNSGLSRFVVTTFTFLVFAVSGLLYPCAAQSTSPLEISRTGGVVHLSWPASVGDWYLACSTDLTRWTSVTDAPTLAAGTLTLDLPATTPQKFFRLHTDSILFVDGSQASNGDGSFASPFNLLSSAVSQAKDRFSTSNNEQTIYVFGGTYSTSVVIDGSDLDGFRLNMLDGRTSIGSNGTVIEGDPGAVAELTATQGSVLSITAVESLRLTGFDLTGPPAPPTGAGEEDAEAPAVIAISNSQVILQDVIAKGGQASDGSVADEGLVGGDGGAGLIADVGSSVDIIDSDLRGGNAGNGGNGVGDDLGGNGGRGGNGAIASGETTIRIFNSMLAGGDGGLAGTPLGIFSPLNGAGGSGAFAEGESFLTISSNSEITGGNAIPSFANSIHGAVQATDSTVDIINSTLLGGDTGSAINTAGGLLNITTSTAEGGPHGGTGTYANNTEVNISDSTLIGGGGLVLENTAYPAGDSMNARGASRVTIERSTVSGGQGSNKPDGGNDAGRGGTGFVFELADPGGSATIIDSFIYGGNSGAGGGGFNASGGEGVFADDAVVDFRNTYIIGGTGSNATSGGGSEGGDGGDGLVVTGGSITIDGGSQISAGDSGNGDSGEWGGLGGHGVRIGGVGGTVTLNGTPVSGGDGGNGGAGEDGREGGDGVRMGFPVPDNEPGTVIVNSAQISGGRGGDGGSNGDGGDGGAGARVFANGTIHLNNSTVIGADGGNGNGAGSGGAGGLAADNTPAFESDPGVVINNGSTLVDGNDGSS